MRCVLYCPRAWYVFKNGLKTLSLFGDGSVVRGRNPSSSPKEKRNLSLWARGTPPRNPTAGNAAGPPRVRGSSAHCLLPFSAAWLHAFIQLLRSSHSPASAYPWPLACVAAPKEGLYLATALPRAGVLTACTRNPFGI